MHKEYWHFHKNKTISGTPRSGSYRQHGQQNAAGILRSVRMSGNDLEYFIFEDDDMTQTDAFLSSKKPLDFDYANIRIPAGFRNVKYALTENGLIDPDAFDTEPQQIPLEDGFFGTLLLHFREAGTKKIRPFIHENGLFHHCEAVDKIMTRGTDCPTLMHYGFASSTNMDAPSRTAFGKLKIFFYEGKTIEKEGESVRLLGSYVEKDRRNIYSDYGFYLIPMLFPDKSIAYAVVTKNNKNRDEAAIKRINAIFFKGMKDSSMNLENDVLYIETYDQIKREDHLSIMYKKAHDQGTGIRARMEVGGCQLVEPI